ncbi:MAG: MMPL family transporter [Gammaproteobacteria bacterium]|nr:MMPL family transporter [Gammaproteobacteria bacterium]
MKALTDACWQIPFSSRVDSLTNFQFTSASHDELIVEDFIPDPKRLEAAQRALKRRQALAEPLLVKRLLAADAGATAVVTNVIFAEKAPEAVERIAGFSRQLRDEFQAQYPDMDFYLTGSVMFDMAFSEVGRHDMMLLAPVMFFILVLVVGFSVRSVPATLATMLVILMSMLSAMGIAGWLGISVNPASANAPTIILTLAVADSVHILVTMYRLIYSGKRKNEALVESLTLNMQAVFLTSLTTAIGFLTMNFSDASPFHDLGNIVAIGVTMAFLYSVFFLPALIAVLPVKASHAPVIAAHGFFSPLVGYGYPGSGINYRSAGFACVDWRRAGVTQCAK